jgi:HAMP domain-containing protein
MTTSRKTWSWRTRLLTLLLLFAVVPLLGISIWSLEKLEETHETNTVDALKAIAHARAEAIDQIIGNRRRDVERIVNQVLPRLISLREAEATLATQLVAPLLPAAPVLPLPELKDAQQSVPGAPTPADEIETESPRDAAPAEATPAEAAPAEAAPAEAAPAEAAPGKPPRRREIPVEPLLRDRNTTAPPVPQDLPAARAVAEAMDDLHQVLGLILWDPEIFEELLVIGEDGVVIASTFHKHEGKTAEGLEYFQNGLKATYLQPPFLSPITERLTMVIATPIRTPDLKLHGVLVARLNLERFFRLINDLTGLGTTGEILVGKLQKARKPEKDKEPEKDRVVFMAPTRHDAEAALQRSIEMGARHSISLQEAARGLQGAGKQAADYRGKTTLEAWLPVPSLDWGMVVKIDYEEAMRPVQTMRTQTWLMALALLVIVVTSAFVVSRELVRPLRTLKDAADRISRGDLDVQLEIRSNDEIGELADSFERMVAATKYLREHARRADEDDEEDVGNESTESQ